MTRNHVIALARGTFLETVRDRVFYLVAVFGFIMMGSTTILSPLTIGAQGKIVSDVGLAAMTLLGLLVVVFVGSGMVHKELDKGTITTILSRPVGRREYLLGKFLGLNLTMAAMLAVMSVLFLLMLLLSPGAFSPRFGIAFYMAFIELSLITAIVVFFSTCVSPVLSAVFTLGAFVAGHLSESIRDFGHLQQGPVAQAVGTVVYYLLPNLEVFNVRGSIVHGDPVTAAHIGLATLYAVCWSTLLLLLSGAVFSRRELRG
jgi:hypothetical protein